jgi:hypothetical protein
MNGAYTLARGQYLPKCRKLEARQAIQDTAAVDARNSVDDILNALRTGKVAYDPLPNITPIMLLTVRLPIVDPGRTTDYLREALGTPQTAALSSAS